MAYQQKNLSALSYANGFTLWHYRTGDERDAVLGEGYFNDAVRMLRVGDFLLVNAEMPAGPAIVGQVPGAPTVAPSSGMIVVAGNDGTTVAVARLSWLEA